MEISKTYDPKAAEDHWYNWWMEKGFFRSVPDDREPYTIVIPPPNVTGVLHMGHMLNNTIQDVLVRRARMLGKNALWVPGTDHASIATEAKVVALLKEKGISKKDLSREDFLKYAWEWKKKYGGIILEQLKKLGASCDWERTRFTMEEELSEAVTDVFIDLYKKGYIYRGTRMVNWDCAALTAVSDEEVIMKEAMSKLFYVKYQIEDSNEFMTIATTRPETILGDTAVCVHPDDERYKNLKGKKVIVPLVNRAVNIIFDEYVDKEFGTGALKVTPAHDKNDYELGKKHKLESIDVLNPDGTMSKAAQLYIGADRFACRKKIIKDLEEKGHLVKVEEIKNNIGYSERTNAVIEPRLSMQWYVSMKEISKPALENVVNANIKLIPEKFINTYKYWMEGVHDWCISRQLWWGQRIPAWYDSDGNFVVAKTKEEAIAQFKIKNSKLKIEDLIQDEDVVDTWFSSWLWPISVFDPKVFANGKQNANADLKYYYPTNDLVTAPEILFFWVARMIIAGYEYMGDKPFSNVYLTGIVRDKQGRKMSKSLGNSPDPLDLIDKFGADGVRVGMLLCSPAGNDLPFDESLCEQGRNFANKIWNAFRLLSGFTVDKNIPQPDSSKIAVEWFNAKFNSSLAEINDHYSKFRLSDALMSTYKLIWDDFCAWYLEMIKPDFVDARPPARAGTDGDAPGGRGKANPIDQKTFDATTLIFEKLMKVLHPFMPFITEELYHHLAERKATDAIIVAPWPKEEKSDTDIIAKVEVLKEIVGTIRNLRQQRNISPKEKLDVFEMSKVERSTPCRLDPIVIKLSNLNSYKYTTEKITGAYGFMVSTVELFIPIQIDAEEEKKRLAKELEYNKGFLVSVQKKLANEKFVSNAKPELIEMEKKKQADAESKIRAIEQQLANL
ncbi:MAG: valine--tRNA ligase [Bacteroidetes bacterium]|nr:valine--tRNA ligase [Bacteroidota bacterium]